MKNILALIWDFFYKDFWAKIVLIAFTAILSLFKWQGWSFLFLILYLIGYVLSNILTTTKKPKL